jgi:transposase
MQDNARTHTARVVQSWLVPWAEENGIELIDWPLYSPDLNPIENL